MVKCSINKLLLFSRSTLTGLLTKDKDKYQVIAEWVSYDVLTAAVTHFKAEIWDHISVIIPEWKSATFAAIDAVIPSQENNS